MEKYDFCGWATRSGIRCSDGRTIMENAFLDNDGQTVPLVWNHQHNNPENVLGHAMLKNVKGGVKAYAKFNDSESGKLAKILVDHGDVVALSIYANQLKEQPTPNGSNVIHGAIREVSLVLAGANPGAYIDGIMTHSEDGSDNMTAAVIYSGEPITMEEVVEHAEEKKEEPEEEPKEEPKMAENSDKTIGDVFNELTEEQKNVVYAMIGMALADKKNDDEGEEAVKHNVFDTDSPKNTLSHSEMAAIFAEGKRMGSLKAAVLAHGEDDVVVDAQDEHVPATYGIDYIDYLFPDAKSLNTPPEFISRNMDWVKVVMGGVHHTPFSRIKSVFANITEDDARARGYIKGRQKVEEVFGLLKRTTTPQTVYKKQKLDRDDIIDITDFNVVAWIKGEMRMMLDEEIARAILVGDGRSDSSDDKINPLNIRPIMTDADLYTIKATVDPVGTTLEKAFIKKCVKARKDYKGSGNPTLFTTEDMLTDMLLVEDTTGRRIYDTEEKLRSALRVSRIVTVPVMENLTGPNGGDLLGIIVNLNDYNVGADKGGAVNMFDDFDIDYNAQKYLIETRCSGALTKPYAAIVLEAAVEADLGEGET